MSVSVFFWIFPSILIRSSLAFSLSEFSFDSLQNKVFSYEFNFIDFMIMKSKDFQNLVLSKYENCEGSTKTFRDLNEFSSLRTIEWWCKAVRDTGSNNLSSPLGRQRIIRTKRTTQNIKHWVEQRKLVLSWETVRELGISRISIQKTLEKDRELWAYKIQIEPLLTDEHKEKKNEVC